MLTDALKENTTLTYLNLSHEVYDGRAVEYLSQVIGVENKTITSLNISNNAIGNQGALALAHMISQPNCPIHHLHAANGWMTTRGTDAILKALTINTSFHTLDLSGNNIKNGKLLGAALKNQAVLEHLVLDNNCLGDNGIQDLVPAITENHVLTQLDLGNNRIGVAGIQSLLTILPQLTQLSLQRNIFGANGAKLLATKLKNNTSLISFSCYHYSLTHVGKQALVDSLHQSATMMKFLNDAWADEFWCNLLGISWMFHKQKKVDPWFPKQSTPI